MAVNDLFSFDLVDGLASSECPLCYAIDSEVRRWLDSFWREGRQSHDARRRFFTGGGFCRRHAWILCELLSQYSGAAIADLYGRLAEHDLSRLAQVISQRRQGAKASRHLQRRAICSACEEEGEVLERKAAFLAELLSDATGRARYECSYGVCYPHLLALIAATDGDESLTRYVLNDWSRRLSGLRRRLAEYDRTRDYRYASERSRVDERSWEEVVQQYVGAPPRAPT